MSQRITSDRLSERTIARIAGTLLSGTSPDWLPADQPDRRRAVVHAAVATARLIAQVVRETQPPLTD